MRPLCRKCKRHKVHSGRRNTFKDGAWIKIEAPPMADLCRWCQQERIPAEPPGFPTYSAMTEVKGGFPPGTLIRILGNPEPYYDGIYSIRYFGGCCAGKRVWPGPAQFHSALGGSRPKRLRPWPDNMPPGYVVPGYDED